MVTRNIKWFNKNRESVLRMISFGSKVINILDPVQYIICKKNNLILIYHRQINGIYEKRKLVHKFHVKNDRVSDLTCEQQNCPYMTAIAIKYDWIELPKGYITLTKWELMSPIDSNVHRVRLVINTSKKMILYQIRDKFTKMSLTPNQLIFLGMTIHDMESPPMMNGTKKRKKTKAEKLKKLIENGDKRWLNLRPYKDETLSKEAKKILDSKHKN